jgi:hypothetical protein
VVLKGPMTSRGMVEDRGDGTYSVGFKTTQGGPHSIVIRLHGQHIKGSPFQIDVKASETDVSAWRPLVCLRAGSDACRSV